jgi:Lysophospholipase
MRITLIHGTWALENEWTRKSTLVKNIKKSFPNATIDRFPWTGKNDQFYRDNATFRLIDKIKEGSAENHFLIAHSHGGNIAINALADPDILLAGIVTLNTPFLFVLQKNLNWVLDRMIKDVGLIFVMIGLYVSYLNVCNLKMNDQYHFLTLGAVLIGIIIYNVSEKILKYLVKIISERNNLMEAINCERNDSCSVVSFVSGNDEAVDSLQLADSISNIPSILMTKATRRFVFVAGILLFIIYCLIPNLLYPPTDSSLLECLILGLLYVGLAVVLCYIITFILSLVMSFLYRRYSLGIRGFSLAQMIARIVVTPIPVNYTNHSLKQVILPLKNKSLLYHSALYDDPKTSERIVHWIRSQLN